jgi:hypothetical protein
VIKFAFMSTDTPDIQPGTTEVPEPALHGVRQAVHGVGDFFGSMWGDFRGSDERLRLLASSATAGVMESASLLKLSVVTIGHTGFDILHNTHSPTLAGAATGAMFGAWSLVLGRRLNGAINHYPTAVESLKENFPKITHNLSDSLPGFSPEVPDDLRRMSLAARIGNTALTRARRGLTALGLGTGFYVLAGNIEERPKTAVNRLVAATSADCAGVAGVFSFTASELILKLGDKNPELADTIYEASSNPKVLGGLAVMMMGIERGRHAIKKRINKE